MASETPEGGRGQWVAVNEALATLRGSSAYYCLTVDGAHVMFRIDGMLVRLSPTAFGLLSKATTETPEGIVSSLETRDGPEAVSECCAEIADLHAQGVFRYIGPDFMPLDGLKRRALGGILIMVTQTCNLACGYCYSGGGGSYGHATKFQSSEHIEMAIDQLVAESGVRRRLNVTLFGGEPLLDFRLVQHTVSYCEQKGFAAGKQFHFSITTNGTVVSDQIVQFLREKRVSVVVSFDGTPEFQDSNRPFLNGRGSYAAVKRGIQRLVRGGVPVMLRGTIVRNMVNVSTFERMIDEAEQLGVRAAAMSVASCMRSPDTSLELTDREAAELGNIGAIITRRNISRAKEGRGVVYDPHKALISGLVSNRAVGLGRCGAFNAMSAVSTQGRIYPCHRFVGMEDYAIGDVRRGGIDKARRDILVDRASAAASAKCSKCLARLLCGGMCHYTVADGRGGFQPPSEVDCVEHRASLMRGIGYVLELLEMPREESGAYLRAIGI